MKNNAWHGAYRAPQKTRRRLFYGGTLQYLVHHLFAARWRTRCAPLAHHCMPLRCATHCLCARAHALMPLLYTAALFALRAGACSLRGIAASEETAGRRKTCMHTRTLKTAPPLISVYKTLHQQLSPSLQRQARPHGSCCHCAARTAPLTHNTRGTAHALHRTPRAGFRDYRAPAHCAEKLFCRATVARAALRGLTLPHILPHASCTLCRRSYKRRLKATSCSNTSIALAASTRTWWRSRNDATNLNGATITRREGALAN